MLDENGIETAPQGSTRKRAKERLKRVSNDLHRANSILKDIHTVYAPREKSLADAVVHLIAIIAIAEEFVDDINSHL